MTDAITSTLVQATVGPPLNEAYTKIMQALRGFKHDLASLRRLKTAIEAALLDADSMVELSHTQQDTLEKLRCEHDKLTAFLAVREARALRKHVMGGNWFTKELRIFFSPSNQVVTRLRDARKVEDISNKMDAILREHAQIGSIVRVPTQVWGAHTVSTQTITDFVVGRDGDRDNIIRSIIAEDPGEENTQITSGALSVTSIVGIGGLGKTELAWYVYNDDRVKANFDVQIWVDVKPDFNVKEILKKIILIAMNGQPLISEELDERGLFHFFNQALFDKKFLLVLDNIWDGPDLRLKWLYLDRLLKVGAHGSKVLITTRNEKVPKLMESHNTYMLKELNEEDSWLLFQRIAITQWHESGVEKIGRDIVKMCPKLPLVIRSIGGLLAGKYTIQEGQAFRRDQFANFSSYGNDILRTLKLSYDNLDKRLRLCVSYCTLIPKGSTFDRDDMIQYWIALDYVKPTYSNQSLEEAGEEYMTILLSNGFLTQDREIQDEARVQMHHVMYDLVQSLAGSQYKVADSNTYEFDEKVRHLSYYSRDSTV